MDTKRRARLGSGGALALAGSFAASMLLFFVTPVLAVGCPDNGSLNNPVVTPTSGFPTTTFTFSVTYRDNIGETPDWARVYFNGANPTR